MKLWVVVVVPWVISAAACDRAEPSRDDTAVLQPGTEGREDERDARALSAEERTPKPGDAQGESARPGEGPDEPIGAAPEDRGAPMPGQMAEGPESPGSVPRWAPTGETGAVEVEVPPAATERGPQERALPAQERASGAQEQAQPAQEQAQPAQEQAQPAQEQAQPATEQRQVASPPAAPAPGGAARAAEAGRATEESMREGVTEQPRRMATAELETEGEDAAAVEGTVVLTEDASGVVVEANVTGLEPGRHRLSIRDAATCDAAAEEANRAARFGEEQAARAAAPQRERRESGAAERGARAEAGERTLGEIEVGRAGAVRYRLLTNQLSLEESGPGSVVGKTVVIEPATSRPGAEHEEACGVIESEG